MIKGSCHCGKVHWTYEGKPESATACNCSICRKMGHLTAYDYEGERIHGSGDTAIYMWGDKQIEFHFCPECSCYMWWRGRSADKNGRRRMAVNLRMADDPAEIMNIPVKHFDGENWQEGPKDDRCIRDMWY